MTLFEALPDFLAAADPDIAKQGQRIFKKQGLDVRLGTLVKGAKVKKGKVEVTVEDKNGESTQTFDRLLVAVGRRAYTDGLLADDSGVTLTDRGQIQVDEQSRTTADNVWAIGDCVRGPMLAHKATHEAKVAGGYLPAIELTQEAAIQVPWVYLAVRPDVGRWTFFRIHAETLRLE